MDGIVGIGAALAAMRPDGEGRYEDCLMLSALPHAPVVRHRPPFAGRLLRLVRVIGW